MGERVWASRFIKKDISGGAEVMGDQYSKTMNLRQFSAARLGLLCDDMWETSAKMDDFLRTVEMDVLVRNSIIGSTFYIKKPKVGLDIAVCCENFGAEARALSGYKEFHSKFKDHEKQLVSVVSADVVVVPSIFEAQNFIKDGIKSEKISIINPHSYPDVFYPIKTEEARSEVGIDNETKVVLFVGRGHVRKGYDVVLEAVKKYPDVQFISVLSGEVGSAQKDNHFIIGDMEQSRLNLLYNAADVFFFPSRYEGFGLVSAEAMMCGKPVVAYETGMFANTGVFDDYCFVQRGDYNPDTLINLLDESLRTEKRSPVSFARDWFSKERFDRYCARLEK